MESDEDYPPYDSDDYGSDSKGDYTGGYESDFNDDTCAVEDEDGSPSFHRPEETYTSLTEADIRQRQEEEISHLSSTLSLSKAEASLLLCHYKWNVSHVHDKWFADEERVRATVGLPVQQPANPTRPKESELTCGICYDMLPVDQIYPRVCNHSYCIDCWTGYIACAIKDGPGCLKLRCPNPSCQAAVGRDVIDDLASDEEKVRYYNYFMRNYVEQKKKTKWCPAPGCDNAVEFDTPDDNSSSCVYDVTCLCRYSFCWNCTEDAHRPVGCETVSKWVLKNNSEGENTMWIVANSKPCPKCKRPIEKNEGCMHMSCTPPCGFHFCWLCLGDWSQHGEKTGGFYACNRYEEEKRQGLHEESARKKTMAKRSLQRYTHYYERWVSNHKSREKAMKDLKKIQDVTLEGLSDKLKTSEGQLRFIIDAWQQIIECRRVLKWTYAYGYYLPQEEVAKKQLFEYLQGIAEAALERLHGCAERELTTNFLVEQEEDEPEKDFEAFGAKLINLTTVTCKFFENLVRALENGLSDVDSRAAGCNIEDKMNVL